MNITIHEHYYISILMRIFIVINRIIKTITYYIDVHCRFEQTVLVFVLYLTFRLKII